MSETAKHTAGPWKWDGGGYVDAARECIAGINAIGSPCKSEANARLIAAAPDLLAACEAVVEDGYETCGPNDDWPLSFVCEKKVINQLQAAIAKATGDTTTED